MNTLIDFFKELSPVLAAFIATMFTWFMTALGASFVFVFQTMNRRFFDTMLGFTGGVMVAASFWSLLSPAIEMSEGTGLIKTIPSLVGFALGALSLYALDKLIPHLHIHNSRDEAEGIKTNWHGTILLVLAITLHNIPEGLAVGVLFGAAMIDLPGASLTGAITLAIGIGIQNFPEGLAVSMPLRRQGLSKFKSFYYGQMSAVVEPIAGVLGALLVLEMRAILPYALAFAAGAMIYVVIEEVVPESQKEEKNTDSSTLGFILGFCVMMVLDVGFSS